MVNKILSLLAALIILTGCSEFALLSSGTSLAVSNNVYAKSWSGLDDGTYLYPSGGDYKKVVLLGNGDTTYTVENTTYIGKGNPFTTRKPMYLRMGISKRWEGQAVVAMDLVTGFSNRFSSSTTWRLSLGTEITRFKNKFIRIGYAIGGVAKKSLSMGYGAKWGSLYFDMGFSLNGGFSLDSTKGLDLAAGFIWQLN